MNLIQIDIIGFGSRRSESSQENAESDAGRSIDRPLSQAARQNQPCPGPVTFVATVTAIASLICKPAAEISSVNPTVFFFRRKPGRISAASKKNGSQIPSAHVANRVRNRFVTGNCRTSSSPCQYRNGQSTASLVVVLHCRFRFPLGRTGNAVTIE